MKTLLALILVATPGFAAPNVDFDKVLEATQACVASPKNSVVFKRKCIKKCQEAAIANNPMKQCASLSVDVEEAELARVYNALKARWEKEVQSSDTYEVEMAKETLARLKTSQEAWELSHTADCALEASEMLGGSGESLIQMGCNARMSRARILFLGNLWGGK